MWAISTGGGEVRVTSGGMHKTCRHGRPDQRGATVDGEDRQEPRWRAHLGLRRPASPLVANRAQFYRHNAPFYGYNRPGAKISEGIREHWWLQGMMGGINPITTASRLSLRPILRGP